MQAPLLPRREGGEVVEWLILKYGFSKNIFSRFEIPRVQDCTNVPMYSSKSVFPPQQGGVDAAQAGIRKDGRINPDPNPGENVSDVAAARN